MRRRHQSRHGLPRDARASRDRLGEPSLLPAREAIGDGPYRRGARPPGVYVLIAA